MFSWEELQNIYIISDTHFWHKNVKKYCGRPFLWATKLIDNWNSTVGPNDIVLHLGDFALSNFDRTKRVVSHLNGNIYMIRGNHDRHGKQWYANTGITVIPSFVIQEGSYTVYFTHRPIRTEGFIGVNIHGHMHEKGDFIYSPYKGAVYINMSVEHIDYRPVKFCDIMLLKEINEYLHSDWRDV
jgi:calcineurin-like phosphoesterase family protein